MCSADAVCRPVQRGPAFAGFPFEAKPGEGGAPLPFRRGVRERTGICCTYKQCHLAGLHAGRLHHTYASEGAESRLRHVVFDTCAVTHVQRVALSHSASVCKCVSIYSMCMKVCRVIVSVCGCLPLQSSPLLASVVCCVSLQCVNVCARSKFSKAACTSDVQALAYSQ